VAGQGPIGLMFTKILQLQGVRVLATDLLESRLQLAKTFGAKWTELVRSPQSTVHSRQLSADGGQGTVGSGLKTVDRGLATLDCLDCAVIAVPSDEAVHQALRLVRGGGQVLLFAHTKRSPQSTVHSPQSQNHSPFSLQPSAFSLDLASICVDEKDLIGSYSSDFTLQAEVARLVFSRRLDVRQLITHTFPLEQTSAAIALAARPTADSLKILVAP
jgi:L-iditol 2-dehydrogenase